LEIKAARATLGHRHVQKDQKRDGKQHKAKNRQVEKPQAVKFVHRTKQCIHQVTGHSIGYNIIYLQKKTYLFIVNLPKLCKRVFGNR